MRLILLAAAMAGTVLIAPHAAPAQMTAAPEAPMLSTGILPADEVQKLLPPAVYFRGQSAPLQLRNAAAVRYGDGAAFWASLVDTSGYSTAVREKYQFYLVAEFPLRMGGQTLAAGAYGAGFLADNTFVVMDLGGHELFTGKVIADAEMRRPRPLQIVPGADGFRLYLGRQYAAIQSTHTP